MRSFTRYPTTLRHEPEPDLIYELEVFGEMKLSWGVEFFIFRMSFTNLNQKGIGEIRLLPKEEFSEYFSSFTEIPNPELH